MRAGGKRKHQLTQPQLGYLAGGDIPLCEEAVVQGHEPQLPGGRTSAVVVEPPSTFGNLMPASVTSGIGSGRPNSLGWIARLGVGGGGREQMRKEPWSDTHHHRSRLLPRALSFGPHATHTDMRTTSAGHGLATTCLDAKSLRTAARTRPSRSRRTAANRFHPCDQSHASLTHSTSHLLRRAAPLQRVSRGKCSWHLHQAHNAQGHPPTAVTTAEASAPPAPRKHVLTIQAFTPLRCPRGRPPCSWSGAAACAASVAWGSGNDGQRSKRTQAFLPSGTRSQAHP